MAITIFLITCLLFPVFAEDTTVITDENSPVKVKTLSAVQEKGLSEIQKDITYFHKQLEPLMSYVLKNRKNEIKNNKYVKSYKAKETSELGGITNRVVTEDTQVTMAGDKIESIKFIVRRGYLKEEDNPSIILTEMESKFTDDPKDIKLKVMYLPSDSGSPEVINTYDIQNIPQNQSKIDMIRQYKENVRKLVREIEHDIKKDQTRTTNHVTSMLVD